MSEVTELKEQAEEAIAEFNQTTKEVVNRNYEIVSLKAQAEKAIADFKQHTRAINQMGFNCVLQADDTLYVYKDTTTREAFGTPLASPTT